MTEAGDGDGVIAPDITKTESAVTSLRTRSLELQILTVLAVFYTLYFAREFLLPIVYALLLSLLLSPLVRLLARFRVSPPIGGALVIVAILGVLATGAFGLTGSIRNWALAAPSTLRTAEAKLLKIVRPFQEASKTAQQAANTAGAVAGIADGSSKPAEVVVQKPSFASRAFGTTQRSVATVLEVLILLYFLLASGDLFLQKLVKVLPTIGDKRKAVQIARATEASISTYLLTATLVNLVEGVVVAIAMFLLKMPNPALWGALVVLLEFVPYLGSLTMIVILSAAAITTFDGVGHAVLVPTTFLVINLIQANFVSPLLLGHRLSLNPVALFIGLAFWFWIWGIAGAFIAVPLLATFKIFCDHIQSLAAVGEFLGQRNDLDHPMTMRTSAFLRSISTENLPN